SLHALNTRQFDKLGGLLKPWVSRHGQTGRVTEVQLRHALLTYETDLQTSLGFLVNHLGLRFDHQREVPGAAPNLPTALDQEFVKVWVSKLQPGADTDWRRDRAACRAYFDRLWAFVGDLPPVHNALKAHVLFHRLSFDRAEGVFNKARFLAYLQLPRNQPYM